MESTYACIRVSPLKVMSHKCNKNWHLTLHQQCFNEICIQNNNVVKMASYPPNHFMFKGFEKAPCLLLVYILLALKTLFFLTTRNSQGVVTYNSRSQTK